MTKRQGQPVSAVRAVCLLAAAAAVAQGADAQVADVREGTNIAVALSPDGASLIVDLLGGLWQLPATGGGAVALVPAGAGVRQPRFAPDGLSIVAQRWVDGQWDLWLFDLTDGSWRALTTTAYDEREPDFSADGRSVLFAADRTGGSALWALDLADGRLRQLTDELGDSSFPSVSARGDLVYVNRRRGTSTLRLHDGGTAGAEIYRTEHWLAAPSWRPGSRVIVFNEVDGARASTLNMLLLADEPVVKELTHDEDVFPGRVAWSSPAELLYAADGQIWRRGIGDPVRTPLHLIAGVGVAVAGTPAVAVELDAPGPHAAMGVVGTSTTPDGRRTAFAALGDLWLAERRELTQLTDDAFLDAFPSFAPDGESLVFVSDRGGTMDLWRLDLGNGVVTQLTGDAGKPFDPVVDPSGQWVAYLETEGLGRFGETALKQLELAQPYRPATVAEGLYDAGELHWDVASGAVMLALRASRTGPGARQEQLRFAPVPGVAIDADAAGGGEPPRQELADLLPQWMPEVPEEPYVVQVGRVFDGVRNEYLRHMDIHVEGQRITAMVRRGTLPASRKVIDLTEATIYPGLIDVHVRQSVASGERLGRIWLVNGVTTVREVTDDVGEALERAESWASGRRLGPRLVISPASGAAEDDRSSAASLVFTRYPNLSPSLAHVLQGQRERLGIPRFESREPLDQIVDAGDAAAWPLLRVSARNRSYQDTVATLLASETVLSTGLAALAGWPVATQRGRGRASESMSGLFSPSEQRRWSDGAAVNPAVIVPLQETVARILRSGGAVAVASDAPAVPYGYGVHAELTLLAEAGIPNDQVLRLASASGAIALGLARQLGTLEPGKLADFVVVQGDPLARIADAAAVTAVVKGGVWRSREELLARPEPQPAVPR
jgi:hypothetical protein